MEFKCYGPDGIYTVEVRGGGHMCDTPFLVTLDSFASRIEDFIYFIRASNIEQAINRVVEMIFNGELVDRQGRVITPNDIVYLVTGAGEVYAIEIGKLVRRY